MDLDVMRRLNQWLSENGPLTAKNVLEYFRQSPFYDPSANYELTGATPQNVFVICEKRVGPDRKEKETAYFSVVNDGIIPAPTLTNLVSVNVRKSLHYVSQAFQELSDAIRVDPVVGLIWDPADPEDMSSEGSAASAVDASVCVREPPPPMPLRQKTLLSQEDMNDVLAKMIQKIDSVCLILQYTTHTHCCCFHAFFVVVVHSLLKN